MAVCACGFVAAASEVSKALEQASVASSGSAMTDMDDNAETSRRQVEQVPPQEQEKEQAGLKPQVLGSHSPSSVRGSRGVQRAGVCAANHVFTHVYVDLRAHTHACVGECARHCVSLSFPPSPTLSLPVPPSNPTSLCYPLAIAVLVSPAIISPSLFILFLNPFPPLCRLGNMVAPELGFGDPRGAARSSGRYFMQSMATGFPASLRYVCMYVCMYACMHVCMYACMRTYVCMYVCMYVCIGLCPPRVRTPSIQREG